MCLGALYYAAPDRVVYAATRGQEGEHYEDGGRYFTLDSFYGEYAKQEQERSLPMSQGEHEDPQEPFRRYEAGTATEGPDRLTSSALEVEGFPA